MMPSPISMYDMDVCSHLTITLIEQTLVTHYCTLITTLLHVSMRCHNQRQECRNFSCFTYNPLYKSTQGKTDKNDKKTDQEAE